jgi:hypothetical protein
VVLRAIATSLGFDMVWLLDDTSFIQFLWILNFVQFQIQMAGNYSRFSSMHSIAYQTLDRDKFRYAWLWFCCDAQNCIINCVFVVQHQLFTANSVQYKV